MLISEFIERLQDLQNQYGDVPVAVANDYASLDLSFPRFVVEDKKFCCENLAKFADGQEVKCIVT